MEKPWYHKGLRFQCTQCGQCCTGEPGYIWVSENEIAEIAQFLNISIEEFTKHYLRRIGNRYSLKENFSSFDCVFLKDKKCTIYPARPKQCRTFPWWKNNLSSQEAWEETAKRCEGICQKAPLISFGTIQENINIIE